MKSIQTYKRRRRRKEATESEVMAGNEVTAGNEGRATGSEVVAGIEDILTQILLRLPVRSLLRFRVVSKHWLSLISSPHFCALKSKNSCKHISGLLFKPGFWGDCRNLEFVPLDGDQPAPFRTLDFVDDAGEQGILVERYCNGLLLCRDKTTRLQSVYLEFETRQFYVVNPTTRQYTTDWVPAEEGLVLVSVALAFDPRISPYYKLICLFRSVCTELGRDYRAKVYSSETGHMSQLSALFRTSRRGYINDDDACFFWNGGINWIDYKCDGLYFNVDEQRFGTLPMPPLPRNSKSRDVSYYGESNDHLYLVIAPLTAQFDVYEMDREYSGWFVRFRVDPLPMFRAFPVGDQGDGVSMMAIVGRDSFIVFGRAGKAIRYDVKDRVFTKITHLSAVNDEGRLLLHNWSNSVQFIESLHPILLAPFPHGN